MGVVFLARDRRHRTVALKVLRSSVAGDPTARRRLAREVETMQRIRSPNVAEVIDADLDGDRPYIVTRFVPGRTLDDVVTQDGPLRGATLSRLACGLADALVAVHAAGVVHRDVKPGNVMLFQDTPVVIDFGIAQGPDATRLTMTGMFMGTPGYLAPEVIEGRPSSEASDVHAWGATVAFAATGRPPYRHRPVRGHLLPDRERAGRPERGSRGTAPAVGCRLARDPAHRPSGGATPRPGGGARPRHSRYVSGFKTGQAAPASRDRRHGATRSDAAAGAAPGAVAGGPVAYVPPAPVASGPAGYVPPTVVAPGASAGRPCCPRPGPRRRWAGPAWRRATGRAPARRGPSTRPIAEGPAASRRSGGRAHPGQLRGRAVAPPPGAATAAPAALRQPGQRPHRPRPRGLARGSPSWWSRRSWSWPGSASSCRWRGRWPRSPCSRGLRTAGLVQRRDDRAAHGARGPDPGSGRHRGHPALVLPARPVRAAAPRAVRAGRRRHRGRHHGRRRAGCLAVPCPRLRRGHAGAFLRARARLRPAADPAQAVLRHGHQDPDVRILCRARAGRPRARGTHRGGVLTVGLLADRRARAASCASG